MAQASVQPPYSKITDAPKTVKEAIDWLLRIGRKDDSYKERNSVQLENFCESVKKLLGNSSLNIQSEFDELCKKLGELIGWEKKDNQSNPTEKTGEIKGTSQGIGKDNSANNGQGYKSAYEYDNDDYLDKRWMSCGARKDTLEQMNPDLEGAHGVSCCSDSEGTGGCTKCGNKDADCPTGGCCPKCPEAACARIFCLIIPVLHTVLKFLHDKLNGSDGWTGPIKDGAICTFLTACGFEINRLNDQKQGSDIKEKLKNVVDKLKTVNEQLHTALKEEKAKGNFLKCETKPVSNGNPVAPASLTDMLLWLQFLPYSTKYKDVLDKAKSSPQNGDLTGNLTQLYSQLPLLFFTIGGKEGMQSTIFDKIGQLVKCEHIFEYYSSNADNCYKTLLGIICTLYPCLRYLNLMCNGSWKEAQLDGNGKDNKKKEGLKNYLGYMGFDDNKLKSGEFKALKGKDIHDRFLNGDKDTLYKNFEKVYESAKAYFKKQSNGSHTPSTVREMMLWLMGLPYCKGFDGLKKHIKTLCEKIYGNTDSKLEEEIETMLLMCAPTGMCVMNVIEKGDKWSVDSSKGLHTFFDNCYQGKDNGNSFKYENDTALLFKQFVDYAYKVTVQLRFLYSQCKESKNYGGWKECQYGNGTCTCDNGSGPLKTSCLKKFLEGGSEQLSSLNGNNGENKFYGLVTTNSGDKANDVGMGFQGKLNGVNGNKTGNDILDALQHMVDKFVNTPLCVLTVRLITIGQREPESLGDCFELFTHMKKDGVMWNNNGEAGQLQTAIQALFPSHFEQNKSHKSDLKDDLYTLMCYNTQTSNGSGCAPYMSTLSFALWYTYVPACLTGGDKAQGEFPVLQWLYDMSYKLLRGLQHLKNEFDNCSCCSKKNCGNSIVDCKMAHPMLYRAGFTFMSSRILKSDSTTCEKFKEQLGKVIATDAPLYNVFKKIIDLVYIILLDKALKCVTTKAEGLKQSLFKDRDEDKTQWEKAFKGYVQSAMQQSKKRFDCTFLCKLFDVKNCQQHNSQSQASPSSTTLQVTKSAVTSISPIIPQYTAPVIDRYHYKTYKKGTTTTGKASDTSGNSTPYTFQSAIDFHVSGANCIRPTPVALRSVIDWILRVTTGAIATGASATQKGDTENGKNEMIQHLSEAVKSVFQDVGVIVTDDTEVNAHVVSLVEGLRTFMGYQDKSQEVKEDVTTVLGTNGKNGVKKLLEVQIEEIKKFIGQEGNAQFASELGKALLKGRYAGTFKQKREGAIDTIISTFAAFTETITGIQEPLEQKAFKDVVGLFTKVLSSNHEGCKELKCNTLNSSAAASQSNDQKGGLEILKEFFEAVAKFNQWTYEIGDGQNNKSSSDIVLRMRQGAEKTVSEKAMNGANGDKYVFYNKLITALTTLGGCHALVDKLMKQNGADTSSQYRTKIQDLINKLNEVLEALKYQNNGEKKDIPLEKVESANQNLIARTKANVENRIKWEIQDAVEEKYKDPQNGNCTVQPPHTQHNNQKEYLCITSLLQKVMEEINKKLEKHKSHLDDLKQLCQWLYRMGQLYAHGLKGFVESLVKHLEHIIEVIKWIEKLHGHLKALNASTDAYSMVGAQHAIPAKNIICKLLSSYVLKDADSSLGINDDNASTYRGFLSDLRLLALDRYTLQVWQDECNKNAKDCRIKDWITFENGIIRHSDLNAVKTALHTLTGVAYNNASSSATPSASHRIHDFHAICVIQKFSYEAPIAELEKSLKELNRIKDKLSAVKQKCNGKTDVSSDTTVIQPFCKLFDAFLSDPYGVFNLAQFLHTILGPNIFSAVIAALEELKDPNKYQKNNGSNGNLEKIKGILEVLVGGMKGENGQKQNDYKLENICKKLESFIDTLRREYIFAYPVVTATATQAIAPHPAQPTIPTCPNRDHSMSSICAKCHPFLARIFIGSIPNLYRHCRLLYEMCNLDVDKKATWNNDRFVFERNGVYVYNNFYLSLGGYMSRNGWIVKGLNEEMDNKELYELDPNGGGYLIHGNLYDVVSSIYPLEESNKNSLKPLDKLFKTVMQHFKDERKKKIKKRIKDLEDKFKNDPNNKGIPFQAPLPALPSTVRQVLFWLHEMDTNKEFYDAMSQHIDKFCRQSTIPISHDTILHVLKLSITQCLEVLATIEDPGRQNAQYYYELYTEEHYYAYPEANIPLFFYTFVEKLMGAFLELNFVCVQCEFRATEGGWKDCHIGKSEHSMKGQNCRCTKSHTTVSSVIRVSVEGSVVCPRPLYSFLFDNKTHLRIPGDGSQRLPYMSKGTMPCGFKLKNKASTDPATKGDAQSAPTPTPTPTSMTGSVLVEPLKKLVGGHVTGRLNDTEHSTLRQVIYLRDLLRYVLCLAVRPPWSMSENMAFFYRVTESWKKDQAVGGVRVAHPNANLLGAIHAEIDMFPGTFEASLLTSAVERFAGVEDTEHQKTKGTHSNTSHQYDLRTLMGCQETNNVTISGTTPAQCSTFMFPLSLDVYTHYDHRNSRAYLSWILNFAFGIYGQLRGLEEMMSEKECVKSASQSTSQCPLLPMCPGVLTALYQSGSSFMDQGQLANKENNKQSITTTTTRKTCDEFHTVLSGLFNCNTASCTPLHNLIVQCEAFLWSIRLPFSLVQLSLWSVAILFISYVFVVPLDHFKIKSHLFNRLKYTMHPSLLITDQQRRVSEVAYFSL